MGFFDDLNAIVKEIAEPISQSVQDINETFQQVKDDAVSSFSQVGDDVGQLKDEGSQAVEGLKQTISDMAPKKPDQ